MPRPPERPDVPLGPPGPLGRALAALQAMRTPLRAMEPNVLEAVVLALLPPAVLASLPLRELTDDDPPLPVIARRLRRLWREYAIHRRHSTTAELAAWAFLLIRGGLDRPDTCDPLTLVRHKALALDALDGLAFARHGPDWGAAIRGRLRRLFPDLARFPCACGQAHTTLPPLDTLTTWPETPGALAVRALAWYHRRPPATMRRLLAEASARVRRVSRELEAGFPPPA